MHNSCDTLHTAILTFSIVIFLYFWWQVELNLLLHTAKAEFECIFMSIMYAIFLLCLSVIQVDPTS